MKGLLPETIRTRTKQPYRAPDSQSFFSDGRAIEYVAELLDARRLRDAGYFDPQAVEKLVREVPRRPRHRLRRQHGVRWILSTMLVDDMFLREAAGARREIAPMPQSA